STSPASASRPAPSSARRCRAERAPPRCRLGDAGNFRSQESVNPMPTRGVGPRDETPVVRLSVVAMGTPSTRHRNPHARGNGGLRRPETTSSGSWSRQRAAEYDRLAELAAGPAVAEQLRVFGESYAALATKLGG